MRKLIKWYLQYKFVPMTKSQRSDYEFWCIDHKFPFKELIMDVWAKEIKSKYPDIGEWKTN